MWLMSVKLFCSVNTNDQHTCQCDYRQHVIPPCYHDNLIKRLNQLQRLSPIRLRQICGSWKIPKVTVRTLRGVITQCSKSFMFCTQTKVKNTFVCQAIDVCKKQFASAAQLYNCNIEIFLTFLLCKCAPK